VFSTWLVKPTSSNTTYSITNNIDVSGKGGMVWMKARDTGSTNNLIYDTARGASSIANNALITNSTSAQQTANFDYITGLSNGFTVNFATGGGQLTNNGINYASWTFRERAKFFDVVTYTGNGANRTIAHNLGSVPGCIFVKRTDTTANWQVYHRSLANTQYMVLNLTNAVATGTTRWNSTTPTASEFSLGGDATVNASGGTYVAYLFAHDAGGFGATGTDNVISCGIYTGNGSATGPTVTLGYEPQWIMIKRATNGSGGWWMFDNMRGLSMTDDALLQANTSDAESSGAYVNPTATGFQITTTTVDLNVNASTYIYIAIRRGPMKTPTTGTSVFGLSARTGTGANATVTGGQTDDAVLIKNRGSAVGNLFAARLTGTGYLETSSTAAEVAAGTTILQANPWDVMDGVKLGTTSTITNASANTYINYLFRRAPGFYDTVCYTGTGANTTVSHNLGAVPELMLVKQRNTTSDWIVYQGLYPSIPVPSAGYLRLNTTAAWTGDPTMWNSTPPTSTVFTVGTNAATNASGGTYIAHLFATVPGVSKIGTYTATTGVAVQVNCGFASGARFVLIKRISTTGDWYLWDSARGIVAGNDPYLLLNSTAAEVTATDYIDPYSAGFEISSSAPLAINQTGSYFIFLAIA
jgi:hypothetical protein